MKLNAFRDRDKTKKKKKWASNKGGESDYDQTSHQQYWILEDNRTRSSKSAEIILNLELYNKSSNPLGGQINNSYLQSLIKSLNPMITF